MNFLQYILSPLLYNYFHCHLVLKSLLSFFLSFIYFYQLEANYFTILQWFLSYIDMNQPWIYKYSPSRSPLPPHSPPNSSGSSQCTRPKHLSHAFSLGWFKSLLSCDSIKNYFTYVLIKTEIPIMKVYVFISC